jgi:hypothetical protein
MGTRPRGREGQGKSGNTVKRFPRKPPLTSRTRRGRRGFGGVPRGGGFGVLTGGGFIARCRGGLDEGGARLRFPRGGVGIGNIMTPVELPSHQFDSLPPCRRGEGGGLVLACITPTASDMLAEGGVCHHVAARQDANAPDPARRARGVERANRVVHERAPERGKHLGKPRARLRGRRAHGEGREKARRARAPRAGALDAALRSDPPRPRELEPQPR